MTLLRQCCLSVLVPALPLLAAAPAFGQPCQPYWANAGQGLPTDPRTLALFDDSGGPALYGAGESTGGDHIYRWNGRIWQDLSSTLPSNGIRAAGVLVLRDEYGPALYAGGWIQDGTGQINCWARRWDGTAWAPTPEAFVPADCSAGPHVSGDLGGGFRIFGLVFDRATNYHRIVMWSLGQWVPISDNLGLISIKLVVFDDGGGPRLYALGHFVSIGAVRVDGFARWTGVGTVWERPPSNHRSLGSIKDVAAFDDGNGADLYAYGDIFLDQDPNSIPGVGRWDGQTWVNLGGPVLGPNQVYTRSRIEVFDDGRGPALYVTGGFLNWGGISARGIARWDGQAWSAVGAGIYPGSEVNDMVAGVGPHGPALYSGGILSQAGGGSVRYVAELVGCPNCYANCDYSTAAPALNINDFVCFMQKFTALDPYANCDLSTSPPALNINDFICFMGRFAAGCP